jgi:hypothetical protein
MKFSDLLETPLPVDRVARRVTRKAKPENVWMPSVRVSETTKFSREVLEVTQPPRNQEAHRVARDVIGRRRDRMVVIGYAKEQGSAKQAAKWVCRCDCGNFEVRSAIKRWLGTDSPDMCLECRKRTWLTKGEYSPREPAKRSTRKESA